MLDRDLAGKWIAPRIGLTRIMDAAAFRRFNGPPTSFLRPLEIGEMVFDEVNAQFYVAVSLSPAQWTMVGGGGGGGETLDPTDPLESGVGIPAGYEVAAILPFGRTLAQDLIRPDNLATARLANNFSTDRDRRATSDTSVGLLADAYFTGRQDAGDGVALAESADLITISGGKMTMKARLATAAEKAVNGTRSNASGPSFTDRPMVWGHPTLFGWGVTRGPGIMDIRFRVNSPAAWSIPASSVASSIGSSGKNPGGSVWMLRKEGGSEAQGDGTTGGEYDAWELHYEWRHTSRGSGIAGDTAASRVVPDTLMVQRIEVSPSDDVTKIRSSRRDPATLAIVGTTSAVPFDDDGVGGNVAAGWEWVMGVFNATSAPFAANFATTDWTGQELTLEVYSMRWLMPTGKKVVAPLIAPQVVTIAQSETGTKIISIPAAATIWGPGTWTETLRAAHLIDTNGPGRTDEMTSPRSTSGGTPAGWAQNLGTREITLTLGTFKKPGMVMGLLYAEDADTSFIVPHRIIIRVAPTLQIPQPASGSGAVVGSPFSYVIPRDDGAGGRYWDCGNLAYGAPGIGGLEVTSLPPGWTWTPSTRTISSGGNNVVSGQTTVGFKETNGAGDVTTQSVDFLDAGWTPASISSGQRVFVLDPKDTTTVPGADAATVGTVTDRYTAGRTLGATGGQEPTIKAAGGPSGAHRTLAFNGSQMLKATLGANNSGLIDLFDTANFTTGSGYACFYAKTSAAGVQRFFGCYNSSGGSSMAYRHGASDRGCGYNVGTARTVVQATQDTSWHVIELIKAANAITVTLDGTDIATGTVTDTGALDAVQFLIGGYRTASTDTAGFTGEVYRGVCLNTVPDGVTVLRSDIRTWVAAA